MNLILKYIYIYFLKKLLTKHLCKNATKILFDILMVEGNKGNKKYGYGKVKAQ